jgi:beta-galactosidase
VQFAIPRELHRIQWYGRGDLESYPDRKTGMPVGLYSSTVEDWITHYVRPQENANRTDVRWVEFTDASGRGFRLIAQVPLMNVSAWPYSMEDLEAATHDYQLPRREFNTINLDGFLTGVGGDNSWGAPVHDEYRFAKKGTYLFRFSIQPAYSRSVSAGRAAR